MGEFGRILLAEMKVTITFAEHFRSVTKGVLRKGDCYFSAPSVSELNADNLCAKTIGRNVMSITNIATTLVTGRSRGRVSWEKIQIGSVVC